MADRVTKRGTLLFALFAVAILSGPALAKITIIAAPSVGGPAGAMAGHQIATWPTLKPVEVLTQNPASFGSDTSLAIELQEDFDFHGELPVADGATIRVEAKPEDLAAAAELANQAAKSLNETIAVSTQQFVVTTKSSDTASPPRITITTSTKNEIEQQRIAIRTRQFRIAVHSILLAEHAIDPSVTAERILGPKQPGVVRVAFYDDLGARNRTAGCNPSWVRQSMRGLSDLNIELVSAEDIQHGALNGQFDVLIMGGGSSRTEGKTLGDDGKKQITQFVDSGGGYVGICAGAFLAAHNTYGLGIAPAKSKPSGGGGLASLTISDDARTNANLPSTQAHVAFHGGPILSLLPDAEQSDTKVWAKFSSDLKAETEEGVDGDEDASTRSKAKKVIPLGDAPAVLSAKYGKGRVVIFAPHPERSPGPQALFWTGVRFAGGESTEQLRDAAKQSAGIVDPIAAAQ